MGKLNWSPERLASFLTALIEGSWTRSDYDDFDAVALADPRLEEIRQDVFRIRHDPPFSEDELAYLRGLKARIAELAGH